MYESRTITDINDLLIAQMEAQFGVTFPILPKSFIRILAKVLGAVFIILYKVAGWIFLQLFVSTAFYTDILILGKTINPLKEWGRLVGAGDPDAATEAELTILITVNSEGSVLDAGTQFVSTLNDIIYITQENYTLTGSTMSIDVIATEGGTEGNLEISDTLSLANTIGIIENDATVTAVLTLAVDEEDEEDYRNRVIERFQLQPQGGAYADYRIWASDAEGVLQTYIYTGDPPSNVMIYVAGDPEVYVDRVPDAALLLTVGAVIDFDPITGIADRRPLGAVIDPDGDLSYDNIQAVTLITFDVEITSLVVDASILTAVQTDIKAALTDYFLSREPYIEGLSVPPKVNSVTQANTIGIVNQIVKENSGTFLNCMNSISGVLSTNRQLGEGELAKLGTLIINGVSIV